VRVARTASPVVGIGILLAIVAGCANGPASPSASPRASVAPTAAASATTVPRSTGSAGPSVATAIPVDDGLLAVLPATLDGLDRHTDPEVDAQAFSDPSLRSIASAGATAVYVDAATGDFAYATVLRLLGGSIGDAAFRSYRDSFDAGACSQAGGISGHAVSQLGGRTTYIGSCAGGLLTYHVVLPAARVLLSISSAGTRRLGEQLASAAAG
jgi:hypothetical protein